MDGDLIARYFERVLGVRGTSSPGSFEFVANIQGSAPSAADRAVCLLVEVGHGSAKTPSLQQMGARLLEAIRSEWLKNSVDHLPRIEWMLVDNEDWEAAILDHGPGVKLAIICGAVGNHSPREDVVHVASFAEMQGNPVLKRDSWRAMQQKISSAAYHDS